MSYCGPGRNVVERFLAQDRGSILMEAVVSLGVVSMLTLGYTQASTHANITTRTAVNQSIAAQAAQAALEQAKATSWANIGLTGATDPATPAGTLQPTQITTVRGLAVTLQTQVTWIQKPASGSEYGTKQVVVTASWQDNEGDPATAHSIPQQVLVTPKIGEAVPAGIRGSGEAPPTVAPAPVPVAPTPTPTATAAPTPTPTPTPTPVPLTPIQIKYNALNGPVLLGSPTTAEIGGLVNGGMYQMYANGGIVWSPAYGAFDTMFGPIRDKWSALGSENGILGYPTSDETGGLVNGGKYQNYAGGAILWSSSTGAFSSPNGPIRDEWGKLGYQDGGMGYPTTNVVTGLKDGGAYQNFQGGAIIWSQATGAHMSVGGIRNLWASLGYENGPLGYPTTDELYNQLPNGGVVQHYQGGSVYWTPATGAHEIWGGIGNAWLSVGGPSSKYGYPVSNEYSWNGLTRQDFQGGYITWNPANGNLVMY